MTLLAPLVLVLAVLALVSLRHGEPARRSLALRRSALGYVLAFAVLAGLFVAGETGIDPGGWQAFALDASWLVPMLGLSALAWWRPGIATPVLIATTALGLGVDAVATLADEHGRLSDGGPVGAVSLFAAGVAVGVLGWWRPRVAALLLLAIAVVPSVVLALGSDVPLHALLGGSTAAGSVPFVVAAALYGLAARADAASVPGQPSGPAPSEVVRGGGPGP